MPELPTDALPTGNSGTVSRGAPLAVMTLNLQYFASYPADTDAAESRLREVTGGDCPPDLICVQEGLAERDVLTPLGFELVVCSGASGMAQSVFDMVYGDPTTLAACEEKSHCMLLCNQIYRRRDSGFEVLDHGVIQISTDLALAGGGGRAEGKLAIRSMAWVKVRARAVGGQPGRCAYVLNTHLTGGRFEDQYFVQQLAEERVRQPDRIISFFNEKAQEGDVGILLGDFNATAEWTHNGPMHGYYKFAIANSKGVQADAAVAELGAEPLEDKFKDYMVSPFKSIGAKNGWTFAYGQNEVGATSGFGHLIDHMAMNIPLQVLSATLIHLTNQKVGNKPKDTEIPLTDHNSVKCVFLLP